MGLLHEQHGRHDRAGAGQQRGAHRHKLDGGDHAGLLALISKKRAQAEKKLGRPVRVVSCYEAGFDGFWLHRWLVEQGIENRVLDPSSIELPRARGGPRRTGWTSSG